MNDYMKEWEAIASSKDLPKALVNHFSYLADSPGYDKVLEAVMSKAVQVTLAKSLSIRFSNDDVLIADPPLDKVPKKYPNTYGKFLTKHRVLQFLKSQVALGEHGNFNNEDGWFDALKEEESVLLEVAKPRDIICPIWDYADAWLYHPVERNPSDEPVLYYFSHEGGDIGDPQECNAGSLFLKLAAIKMGLVTDIESASTKDNFDKQKWWNDLSDEWQTYFKQNEIKDTGEALKLTHLNFDDIEIRTLEPIRALKNVKHLRLVSSYVTDLSPLAELTKLESLVLTCDRLTDISALADLKKIDTLGLRAKLMEDFTPLQNSKAFRFLDLSGTKVKDLTLFSQNVKLETIRLAGTPIEDLSSLKVFTKLKVLDIANTGVQDFSVIRTFKKLEQLDISHTSVATLDFLSKLASLTTLSLNNTKVISLVPVNQLVDFTWLESYGTGITLELALQFILTLRKNPKRKSWKDCTIYYREPRDFEGFVEDIEKIKFNVDDYKELLERWAKEKLKWIRHNREPEALAKRLIQAARNVGISLE